MANISLRASMDEFGDRMKSYEAVETSRKLDASLPIYARIDGRSFSRFTRGMSRPYDVSMSEAMIQTTKHLVAETHAIVGYTQSDEISLLWHARDENSDIFFSGKLQKIVSVIASMAAAKFATVCPTGYRHLLPHFDARVFQLPSRTEAANAFLWRALDARKNAVSMAAQTHFSAKQLHGMRQGDMLKMLEGAGVWFEDYPGFFKNGTFIRKVAVERELTPAEMQAIPEKFRPTGPVVRSDFDCFSEGHFRDIEDRTGFIFSERS